MVDSVDEEFVDPGFDLGWRSSMAKGAMDSPVEDGLVALFESKAWTGVCATAEDMFAVFGFEDVAACGIGAGAGRYFG